LVVSAGLAIGMMIIGCLVIIFFSTIIMAIASFVGRRIGENDVTVWSAILCFAVVFIGITYGIYKNNP
jgi:small neutral amino acid transporter SnatA (MarC family)